jgi:hypothetical protein
VSSGVIFARFKIAGKQVRKSLKPSNLDLANAKLAELERERKEHRSGAAEPVARSSPKFLLFLQSVIWRIVSSGGTADYLSSKTTPAVQRGALSQRALYKIRRTFV